jgi:hypothetical protein
MLNWSVASRRLLAFVKFSAKAIPFSALLLLLLLIVFHNHIVDDIYKNVDDLNDGEMPTTVTSYPSGPEVVGIIGGSGEGLNCSLPWGLDVFFDGSPDSSGNRHLVRQRFRQACVFHDLCYRHGLATYGYSQNDCDRVLQNQAFRLCQYIGNRKNSSDRCQSDSKKILAGVSLGGFGAYRGWDRSTYFEFDSDPIRSREFSASRVVDHPFKSDDPSYYRDDARQVILTFANVRSNLTVGCVTCKNPTIPAASPDLKNVSNELKSPALSSRIEAPAGRELSLSGTTIPVWLPPRRHHAAPHLLVDGAGKHHLIWMSRSNAETTGSCIVSADAARLLSDTLPKRDLCNRGSGSQLTMVEAEMLSSSPLPMLLPGAQAPDDILATGLTTQVDIDHSLRLCLWSERLRAKGRNRGKDAAICTPVRHPRVEAGLGLGGFQNFTVVRPGQQVIFARDIALPPASNPLAGFFEHVSGNTYSSGGSVVVVDVLAPTLPAEGPGIVKVNKISPFTIDDRFDPMTPLTRKKDDLKFLSLLTSGTRMGLYLTDFAKDNPVPREIGLSRDGVAFDLDRSWGLRPVVVVETREAAPKTKLFFSRMRFVPGSRLVDKVELNALVLEREASDPADKPFSITGEADCTVTYTIQRSEPDPDHACLRTFDPARPMRSSPAARMSASQLLVGHFTESEGLGLAFVDGCLDRNPLVLTAGVGAQRAFTATDKAPQQRGVKREVVCKPPMRTGVPGGGRLVLYEGHANANQQQ